jgi:hypothetical protein
MSPPGEAGPHQRRYRVRQQARLDRETPATLEALPNAFHLKHAPRLRGLMPWGLAHAQERTVDLSISDAPHLVHMLMDPKVIQQVQETANARGASVAA